MTLGATESRGEECCDQFPGERVADHKAAQADYVQVVVLDALVRREGFMDQAGPHARYLVGDDTRTNTTAADGHAAIHLPAGDRTSQRHNKIRIIIVHLRRSVAEIDHCMTGLAQHPDQILL